MQLRTAFHVFNLTMFDRMVLLDDEKDAIRKARHFLATLHQRKRGFCGIITRDNQIVCAGGWLEVEPGKAEVFIIPDKNGVRKFPKEFHRVAGLFLRKLEREPWCVEIRTASVDVPRIDGWMRALKFRCGQPTKRYTKSGRKYVMWRRVRNADGVWEPN